MTWHSYEYSSRTHRIAGNTKAKIIYRPLLDIEVSGPDGTEVFSALVDSGSETTIMSTAVAQLIGVHPLGKERVAVGGLGAISPGFIDEVRIVVPEFPKEVLTTSVIFAEEVSKGVPYDILLGQDDFFRRFLVRFEKHKNTFFIAPAS